jgi:hypothetical protein
MTVNSASIYEMNHPDFAVNVMHQDVEESAPLTDMGNLWGVPWSVEITGPAVDLSPDDRAKAKQIQVKLYDKDIYKSDVVFVRT